MKTGETVHKVKRKWSVRFPSSPRLENHAIRGHGYESRTETDGSRCKTLLLMAAPLLKPRHSSVNDNHVLFAANAKQEHHYNTHSRPLPDLITASVRLRLPGEKTSNPGTCDGDAGPKSYDILVGPIIYRRNRRQIKRTCSQDPQLNKDLGSGDESEMRAEEPAHRRSKHLRTTNVRLRDYVC